MGINRYFPLVETAYLTEGHYQSKSRVDGRDGCKTRKKLSCRIRRVNAGIMIELERGRGVYYRPYCMTPVLMSCIVSVAL